MKYKLGDITVKYWNDWDRVPRDPFILFGGNILAAPTIAQVFIAKVIGYIAVSLVTSWALSALAPKDKGEYGLLANARDAIAPQQIVYGEVRKGGIITYIESTGNKNKYLHQIIVLAGHEVNSIGDIYINDEVVTLNSSQDPDLDGVVTDAKWGSKILIKKFTGADNQNVYNTLSAISNGPEWQVDGSAPSNSEDSNFKGEGIACLYVRMQYDKNVFAEGIPSFTAKVQGKKVYDPRTSTTGYSANAALCIRDYLVSSYGLDNTGDTNDTVFQVAANTCDETVTLASSGTEKRYEMNGVISLNRTPSNILADMMTSCAGTLFWGQGKWHLKVGDYTSPVKTFTLDDLRSSINIDTKHSRRDNFNIVRGTFNDASQDFITADYPEIRSSTFISNDNGVENELDLELPFTTSSAMAQRLAKMTLFRAREEMTVVADFGLSAFEVECGDIIALTIDRYGWSAKEFEVVGWKFKNDGDAGDLRVTLNLRETSSSAFSWSAEEQEITSNDSTLPTASESITPSSISVTDTGVVQTDGTFVAQIKVAWTAGLNEFIESHEVQWKLAGASDYAATEIEADENSIILGPVESGKQYNIRVRSRLSSGRISSWVSASPHTVGGDTIAPSPATGLSATGGVQSVTLDWTAPTTQVGGGTLYDLKGYYVYRNTSNSQPALPIAFVSADKYVDGGLSNNTTYYYWVESVDFSGNPSTSVASDSVTTNPELVDGADGASVLVVYADNASGSNQSLSAGSKQFVQYYEYTGSTPSLPVSGTFVQFVGDDGADGANGATGESIHPIYADNASGTNQSFSPSGKTYVTFYESTSAPTLPVSGQTFVKYVGDDGVDGVDGINGTNGTNGADGATGDTVVTGKVYYQTLQALSPTTPSATSYSVSSASFTGLSSGWSLTQPAVDITDTSVYEWSSDFTVTIDGSTSAQTLVFTSPASAIQVTTDLQSDNYVAGTSGWSIERDTGNAEFQNATIRGTLNANDIEAGTLSVDRLAGLSSIATSSVLYTYSSSTLTTGDTATLTLSNIRSGSKILAGFSGQCEATSATDTNEFIYVPKLTVGATTIDLGVARDKFYANPVTGIVGTTSTTTSIAVTLAHTSSRRFEVTGTLFILAVEV